MKRLRSLEQLEQQLANLALPGSVPEFDEQAAFESAQRNKKVFLEKMRLINAENNNGH